MPDRARTPACSAGCVRNAPRACVAHVAGPTSSGSACSRPRPSPGSATSRSPTSAPLYPLAVAIIPAPLDVAFLVVHVAAAFVAVAALGLVSSPSARPDRCCAAIAAPGDRAVGPVHAGLLLPRRAGPLDLFGMIGSDGPAVACGVASPWLPSPSDASPGAVPRWSGDRRRCDVASPRRCSRATRSPARWLGLLAGLVVGEGAWRRPTLAPGAPVALRASPALVAAACSTRCSCRGCGTEGPSPHIAEHIAPIGTDHSPAGSASSVPRGRAGIGRRRGHRRSPWPPSRWLARPGGVRRSLAAVGGRAHRRADRRRPQLLDAGFNLREERHVLLIRFLLAVLVVCGVRER